MKKIKIEAHPKEFQDWLNNVLEQNNFDINENIESLKLILNNYLYEADSTLNRQRLLHDILSCENIKNIKQIRKEKIEEIEQWRNTGG